MNGGGEIMQEGRLKTHNDGKHMMKNTERRTKKRRKIIADEIRDIG